MSETSSCMVMNKVVVKSSWKKTDINFTVKSQQNESAVFLYKNCITRSEMIIRAQI